MGKRSCARPARCADCPFESVTVGSRGDIKSPFVIVGESPGAKEVRSGVPFFGPSGDLLKVLLKEVGLEMSDAYITNAFKCLPPRSAITMVDGKEVKQKDVQLNDACRACRPSLMEELSAHPRKLILTLGNGAMRSVLGAWNLSITSQRGQLASVVLNGSSVSVLPTFHPAHVLRNATLMPQIRSDMKKVIRLLNDAPYPKPVITYKVIQTHAQMLALTQHAESKADCQIVADIETSGLDRFTDKLRCIGIAFVDELRANGSNTVYLIPAITERSVPGELVRLLFTRLGKVARWIWHNGKFDVSFLRAKGIHKALARVDEDTLLLSYALDEIGGRHGLEQCIIDHLGLPSYKDRLKAHMKETKTTFGTVDREHLYQYNAEDVVFTGLLYKKLRPMVMASSALDRAYTELLIPASNVLATIELNGMPIDQTVLERSAKELFRDGLAAYKEVCSFVVGTRWLLETDDGDEDEYSLAINNPAVVKEILVDHFHLKVDDTSKESLEAHKKHPFVAALLKYRGRQKLLSTYVNAFRKYGNRVHTSFLLHGTVTGRLSSSGPNMQNIPKVDVVRRHFRTRPGRIFLACDYSQAELRSLAVLSGDRALMNIFASGEDLHTAVAAMVFGKEYTALPDKIRDATTGELIKNPAKDKIRRKAKTINFGVVYGVTPPTLAERLDIPLNEAVALVEGWFDRFPRAHDFMQECRRQPMTGRPLTTVFGRSRRFYLITEGNKHSVENEAGNFPHQSMCSDFTLAAAIEMEPLLEKLPGNPKQVNIIHDDNTFEVDNNPKAISALAKTVTRVMERVPVKYGIRNVKFETEVTTGEVWCAMSKYEPH